MSAVTSQRTLVGQLRPAAHVSCCWQQLHSSVSTGSALDNAHYRDSEATPPVI